jgi:hypothetical protein
MIISAHQPAYLPWLGYFDKIKRSDIFVFLDTVQYEKNNFINRNKIKTPSGGLWLTVPVHIEGHISSTIKEIKIDNSTDWRKKHLHSIQDNYGHAPNFKENFARVQALYAKEYQILSDLCFDQLLFWCIVMKISTKIFKASDLNTKGSKSERLIDLCKHFNADSYISGDGAKVYLDEKAFADAGIQVEYQNFVHPEYPQLWGDFLPNMGVVDFWMNTNCQNIKF